MSRYRPTPVRHSATAYPPGAQSPHGPVTNGNTCAAEATNKDVAAASGTREQTAARWRGRFVRAELACLVDEPRPGAPRTITDGEVDRSHREDSRTCPNGREHALVDTRHGENDRRVVLGDLADLARVRVGLHGKHRAL
ncbi:helix-turn-helix domain-containing protein [Nocardia sp. NPDC004568]|uniref:helix-turn-helix domain-containing protein n=1 Tax=Nocardia sp. NPDC004568 TaxID=3154551 RepID=UPI0033B0B95C